jgi:hypothetical protein
VQLRDSCLNKDIHECVTWHLNATLNYDKDDKCKFLMATPRTGTSAYLRILDPDNGICPSTERIKQDSLRVLDAIKAIRKNDGCVVDDINNRTGRQRLTSEIDGRGGIHPQKLGNYEFKQLEWHPDAAFSCSTVKIESSTSQFVSEIPVPAGGVMSLRPAKCDAG